MENLTILGTGSAMVTKCYNTCFTISNNDEHFLVDAGGGNTILVNLEKSNINIDKIKHMFISHTHGDHILGAPWV
ncbi:MAG: MBL fold metallo-hydrolase, partial [Sarcina sp.]